jgi:SAM-dependent methyltransferase
VPLRLRLLARRGQASVAEVDGFAALQHVLNEFEEIMAAPLPRADATVPEPTRCPACEGSDVGFVHEWRLPGNQAHAAACNDCGLLFVFPQPSLAQLQAYYAPNGAWRASRAARCAGSPEPHTRTEGAAAAIFPALDRFFAATRPAEGARVFDFGCGAGAWLNSFQDHGWDTYGLEPSTDSAFFRHKRLLATPSEPQFHLVIAYHVLEHLQRPLEALQALAGALLPGGYCLVSVPRLDTLLIHGQIDYCLHPQHHIVGFTEPCLRGLLARAGLEVVDSFHELTSSWSKGFPVRLQLLARKTAISPSIEPNAASALGPVIAAFHAVKAARRIKQSRAATTSDMSGPAVDL